MQVFTDKFIQHPVHGPCEVISRGHFPDTIIVKNSSGKEFEIPWSTFYIGVPNALDQNN